MSKKHTLKLRTPLERFLYAKAQHRLYALTARVHLEHLQKTRSTKVAQEEDARWESANNKSTFWWVSAKYWANKAGIKDSNAQLRLQ